MSLRIGLFGGSFDPIHFGHLASARAMAEQLRLDRVWLIVSPRPPHKRGVPLTEERHRLAMARLATEGDPLFEVSDMELQRGGPSYTIDTVQAVRARVGEGVELFWIIGADSLPELPTWHRVADLVRCVTLVTAARPGWTPPHPDRLAEAVGREQAERLLDNCRATPPTDISATDIRRRVAEGRPIRGLTPDAVCEYIAAHRLYQP